jgi:hypothetical protein
MVKVSLSDQGPDNPREYFILIDLRMDNPRTIQSELIAKQWWSPVFIGIILRDSDMPLHALVDARDLRRTEGLPPCFGFAHGLSEQQLFEIRSTGLPCFTLSPEAFADKFIRLFLETRANEDAEKAARHYFDAVRPVKEGIHPRYVGVELDELVKQYGPEGSIARIEQWISKYRIELMRLARDGSYESFAPISPPIFVLFTSTLEDHDRRGLPSHAEIVDRRSAERHGIWSIRHFVARAVQAQPSLIDPQQFPFLVKSPMPRPDARPEEYASNPAGVSPAALAELFKMIRQEADESLPKR